MIILNIIFIIFPDRFSISETFEMESFTKTYFFIIFYMQFYLYIFY